MTQEPKRYERPPPIVYVIVGVLVTGFVGWYLLTQVRDCVQHCNGECVETCEPSILERWLDN